jgi:ribosomal protein S27AE
VTNEDRAQFSDEELHALRQTRAEGKTPHCPRCGVAMTSRGVGGGSFGLGYARKREWLICPRCRRSAIFDVKRGTRT